MVGDFNRKIILEDGEVYCGYGFGAEVSRVAKSYLTLRWSDIRRSYLIRRIRIRRSL